MRGRLAFKVNADGEGLRGPESPSRAIQKKKMPGGFLLVQQIKLPLKKLMSVYSQPPLWGPW